MDPMLTNLNWPAVIVGAVAAFALGMVWFGPIFGKAWATGSHGITPPSRLPLGAMAAQAVGTFLMAVVIGATETQQALVTAILVILGFAALQLGGGLFSQKSPVAALIDAGFVVAMGVVMIAAQAIL
ncbi:MAG: DUF1761 domain-containing protein [Paracoccaceae bacterium]